MAFDAGMLYAVIDEIKKNVLGLRVEKVHQPTKEEIVLLMRGRRLAVNLGSVCPRIALTELVKDNPQAPPMFCMLLRKHLCGAVLEEVSQCGFDRVAKLAFRGVDEMGYLSVKILYAELMGKYSNLVLTDEQNKIIAVAKPIDFSDSEIRQLLPGLTYAPPPLQEKDDPLTVTKERFCSLYGAYPRERSAVRFLTDSFLGTATVCAREIVYRATKSTDTALCAVTCEALWNAFSSRFSDLISGQVNPQITRNAEGSPIAFGYGTYEHLEGCTAEQLNSFGALFDLYFGERDRIERIHSRAADLLRLVSHTESRLSKKLALQQEELADSERADEYRRMGEFITAELYRLKRGATSFEATDYSTDPPSPVTVPLDGRLSPSANAQRYFKLYHKAKTAREMLGNQIELTKRELIYIRSVAAFLSRAETEADLLELREELSLAGYGARMKKYAPQKTKKSKPLELVSPSGYRVLCGKNNLQNDQLTFRTAGKGDLWFHAKGIPGSHVILICDGDEPTEEDYTFAATVAAEHSSATADPVAVDYTRVKNIKKPPAEIGRAHV